MRPFAPRLNPIPLLVALLGAMAVLLMLMAAGPGGVLAALPLIFLLVALAFRCYPGEALIEWMARRLHPRRARPTSSPEPARSGRTLLSPLLLLMAAARPLRGPPLLSSHPI